MFRSALSDLSAPCSSVSSVMSKMPSTAPHLALVAAFSILVLTRSHHLSCTLSEMLYGWTGWPIPFHSSKLYPPCRLSMYRRSLRQDLRRHTRLNLNMEWQGGSLESLRWSSLRYVQVSGTYRPHGLHRQHTHLVSSSSMATATLRASLFDTVAL